MPAAEAPLLANPQLRTAGRRWLHLHALSVLAIAQPLFDQLGRNPTFFVAHRASTASIWLLTLALFLVPGVVLAAISVGAAAVHRRAGWLLHCGLIGVLAATILLPAFSRAVDQRSVPAIAAALAVAGLAAILYGRVIKTQAFLSYIGAFTVAILGLFVFASDANDLFFPSEVAAAGGGGNETSVVMVVFDELPLASLLTPDRQLDETRAPNLVAFANQATWYSDTTTVSPRTQWAVPSMLSGVRATQDSFPTAAQFPQNLFTVTATSHDHLVAETVTRLCPGDVCDDRSIGDAVDDPGNMLDDVRILYFHTLLPTGLAERWLPPITNGWTGFGATVEPSTADAASSDSEPSDSEPSDAEPSDGEAFDWLDADLGQNQRARFVGFTEGLARNRGPTVSYAHVLLPHAPWTYLPDGTVYNGDRIPGLVSGTEEWSGEQSLLDQATHRYLLQLRFTDKLLGDTFDALKATGQYDNSLIIVTADHGTSFTPGSNRREAQPNTLADIAVVPLFVKYPGQLAGEVDARPAQNLDIFPTIADVLDIALTEPIEGQSLRADERGATRSMMRTKGIDDFETALDLDQAIDRIVAVVPNGVPAEDVWGTPATRSMIGQAAVDYLADDATAPFDLIALNGAAYADVSPSGPFIPARFLATLDDAQAEGETIVVAVEGTLAGAGQVVDGSLSAMLDPTALRDGANSIATYLLRDGALIAVGVVEPEPYEATFDAAGALESISRGERVWSGSSPARYTGFAGIPADAGTGRVPPIRGWAGDRETGTAAEHIVVIAGTEVILSQPERTERPDVVASTGDERLRGSGWTFDLTAAQYDAGPYAVALFPDGSMHVMFDVNAKTD